VAEPKCPLASTADAKNGPGLLSPTRRTRDVGPRQQAATVCELDLVQRAIRSWRWAQTLDSKQWPETLDCAYAHVSGHSCSRCGAARFAPFETLAVETAGFGLLGILFLVPGAV
jgi:hypothetical protein